MREAKPIVAVVHADRDEHFGAGALDAGVWGGHVVLEQHIQHRRLPVAAGWCPGGRCPHNAPGDAVDGRVNQIRVAQLAERTGSVGEAARPRRALRIWLSSFVTAMKRTRRVVE